jgi:predicted porin
MKSNGILTSTGFNGGAAGTTNAWILGGSYNFGVANVYVSYERASNQVNAKDKGWSLGAAVPIGTATLSGGYARETTDIPASTFDTTRRGFGGQLTYPLSKRTFVYTELMSLRASTNGIAGTDTTRTFGVGFQHNF